MNPRSLGQLPRQAPAEHQVKERSWHTRLSARTGERRPGDSNDHGGQKGLPEEPTAAIMHKETESCVQPQGRFTFSLTLLSFKQGGTTSLPQMEGQSCPLWQSQNHPPEAKSKSPWRLTAQGLGKASLVFLPPLVCHHNIKDKSKSCLTYAMIHINHPNRS